MWQKRIYFWVHTTCIYVYFFILYEYFYLVNKYSYLLFIFLLYILSTIKSRAKFIDILIFILGWKFSDTLFFRKISVVVATAQTREQNKQQHQMVGVFHSSIPLFMMSIWHNDSIICLSGINDGFCQILFIFPMRSCSFLYIPMH